MKRAIVDYKKLSPELIDLLISNFPHGYGDDDILSLQKPNGEIIEVVELKTEDAIYLVKISKGLNLFMSQIDQIIETQLSSVETLIPENAEDSFPEPFEEEDYD